MSIGQNIIPAWAVSYAELAKKKYQKNQARIEYSAFFLGAIYSLGVMVVASILYYFFQGPFSIVSHWFSNMGLGETGWSFNYGLMGTAILYLGMVILFLWRFSHSDKTTQILTFIATACGLTAVTGIFILTTNPMSNGSSMHAIGSFMYFICTPFFTSFITVALKFEGTTSKVQWLVSIWLVIISILMAPLMIIISSNIELGAGGVLGSMDPRLGIVRVVEWIAVVSFFVWIFITGFRVKEYHQIKKIENNRDQE